MCILYLLIVAWLSNLCQPKISKKDTLHNGDSSSLPLFRGFAVSYKCFVVAQRAIFWSGYRHDCLYRHKGVVNVTDKSIFLRCLWS